MALLYHESLECFSWLPRLSSCFAQKQKLSELPSFHTETNTSIRKSKRRKRKETVSYRMIFLRCCNHINSCSTAKSIRYWIAFLHTFHPTQDNFNIIYCSNVEHYLRLRILYCKVSRQKYRNEARELLLLLNDISEHRMS